MSEYLVRVRRASGEYRATVRELADVLDVKPMPGSFQATGVASTAPAAILQAFAEVHVRELPPIRRTP